MEPSLSLHGYQSPYPTGMLAPHLPPCLPASTLPSKMVAKQGRASMPDRRFTEACTLGCPLELLCPSCSMQPAFHHFRDTKDSLKARTRASRKDRAWRNGCLVQCWAWGGAGMRVQGQQARRDRPAHHLGPTRSAPERHVEHCRRGGRSGRGQPPQGGDIYLHPHVPCPA